MMKSANRKALPFILAAAVFLCTIWFNPSERQGVERDASQLFFSDRLSSASSQLRSGAVADIFTIPRVYILPWNEEPAPAPNPNGWYSFDDGVPDGDSWRTGVRDAFEMGYQDATIEMHYWRERLYDSNAFFAEIWIENPTQIRSAWAGRNAGDQGIRYIPEDISRDINAVVAVNGDFADYRSWGWIIRQGKLIRAVTRRGYVLAIDDAGDFHVINDVNMPELMEKYHIMNTYQFGPALVIDGENVLAGRDSFDYMRYNAISPEIATGQLIRAAAGQIGRLHYLLCCVEGMRGPVSEGISTSELATIMHERGCITAYNLDGGRSAALYLNGHVMNYQQEGGRQMSDILFFATAIPES